ncbi:MAG TPA: dienelactone hydrolase family protein [Candidatus Dormibacteraeota bacterium]|nr:dienelactone hydrolase family protein [Candidatus Dormibacteraeota bacterium]
MIPGRQISDDGVDQEASIEAGEVKLEGTLGFPKDARAVVLFAHGSGSSRHSPRNRYVARVLREAGVGTLLFDLLTADEESVDEARGALRFDIPFLAKRLADATRWLMQQPDMDTARIGYFGASTGAAAALVAAAEMRDEIAAVVSRGGRPDLAGVALARVAAPTLLIVGGEDEPVIGMNRRALAELGSEVKRIAIVPRATHLFEEPGTLEEVARLAADWFKRYLANADKAEAQTPT